MPLLLRALLNICGSHFQGYERNICNYHVIWTPVAEQQAVEKPPTSKLDEAIELQESKYSLENEYRLRDDTLIS